MLQNLNSTQDIPIRVTPKKNSSLSLRSKALVYGLDLRGLLERSKQASKLLRKKI